MLFKTGIVLCVLLLGARALNVSLDFEEDNVPQKLEHKHITKEEVKPLPSFPFILPLPNNQLKPIPQQKPEVKPFILPIPFPKPKGDSDDGCFDSLKIANEKIASLINELSEIKEKFNSHRAENDASSERNNKLETENIKLRAKIEALYAKFDQKFHDSDQDDSALLEKISKLEGKISTLTSDNKNLFKDNKTLQILVQKLKDEDQSKELQISLEKSKQENAKLFEQNKSLIGQITSLSGKLKTLQADFDRLGKLSVEMFRIRKDYDALKQERNDLLKKLDDLTVQSKQPSEENAKLFADNKTLQEQSRKLIAEIKGLKERLAYFESQANKVQDADDDLFDEIEKLKKINADLKVRLEIAEKFSKNSKDSDDSSAKFKGIIAILEKRVDSFDAEKKALIAQINLIKKENEELIVRIRNHMTEIDDLKKKCSSPKPQIQFPPFNIPAQHNNSDRNDIPAQIPFPFPQLPKVIKEKNSKATFIGSSVSSDLDN